MARFHGFVMDFLTVVKLSGSDFVIFQIEYNWYTNWCSSSISMHQRRLGHYILNLQQFSYTVRVVYFSGRAARTFGVWIKTKDSPCSTSISSML